MQRPVETPRRALYPVGMVRFLPLLLLAACASTAPTAYRQSAFPTAPAFSPVEDAPHTLGQPGHLQPESVPRSPYTRVLPPTKEPGLWAADTKGGEHPPPVLLGVLLPVAAEAKTDWDLEMASNCGRAMSRILANSGRKSAAEKLPEKQRRCLAARLYSICADENASAFNEAADAFHFFDAKIARATKLMVSAAKDFAATECAGLKSDRAIDTIADEARDLLRREIGRAP